MTIKEAILKSLDDINDLTTYMDVYNHIVKNNYYDFGTAKTPASTISALLGDFIRNGDTRVKRIKQEGGTTHQNERILRNGQYSIKRHSEN